MNMGIDLSNANKKNNFSNFFMKMGLIFEIKKCIKTILMSCDVSIGKFTPGGLP